MKFCPMCGAEVNGGNFCGHCGASLGDPANNMASPVGMTSSNYVTGEGNPYAFGTQSTSSATYADASGVPKTMLEAFRICFKEKYSTTQGRASLSEYWRFCLFNFLVCIPAMLVIMFCALTGLLDEGNAVAGVVVIVLAFLTSIYCLVTAIPGLCASIRRMHDSGLSGWCLLVTFIPYLGNLIFLYFLLRPSTDGPNQYGPKPGSQG